MQKYKVHPLAKVFIQKHVGDYEEKFAQVVTYATNKKLSRYDGIEKLNLNHTDIKTVFLHVI